MRDTTSADPRIYGTLHTAQVGHPQLPELRDRDHAGGRLAVRTTHFVLWFFATMLGVALVVAFTVRVDDIVAAPGVLEPAEVWSLRSPETGLVKAVLVRTGDRVEAGQTLIQLDPLLLQDELAHVEAEQQLRALELHKVKALAPIQEQEAEERVAQAEARLATARSQLRLRMVDYGTGPEIDSLLRHYRVGTHVLFDQAVAEVRSAEAEARLAAAAVRRLRLDRYDREGAMVKQAQFLAQSRTLQARLQRLDLTAPSAGVVLTEYLERLPGVAISAGASLLEIADAATWRVVLFVAERDVHQVRVGDPVEAEVQAFRSEDRARLSGRIAHISTGPVAARAGDEAQTLAEMNGRYRVVVELDVRQRSAVGFERFRRGYTVSGRIITRSGRIIALAWDSVFRDFGR